MNLEWNSYHCYGQEYVHVTVAKRCYHYVMAQHKCYQSMGLKWEGIPAWISNP